MHDIEQIYLRNRGEFLVGVSDGRLVAMGGLRKTAEDLAEIKRMRVHPDFQGHGIGQRILSLLEQRARELGYTRLHLDTSTKQVAALHLYVKNGFHETRRRLIKGLECIFMEKPLGAAQTTQVPTEFTVTLPRLLDIPVSLEFLRRNGDDLIDRWDGAYLVRTLPVGDQHVAYACRADGTPAAPVLHVSVADAAYRAAVEQAVRATFLTPPTAFADLLVSDPVIAQLETRYPGLRPVRQFDLFAALVRSISAQQVNLRWATTTRRRLAEALGEQHAVGEQIVYALKPERLAAGSVAEVRALQFTTRKAEYIISTAEAIASGRLDLPALATLPDEEVIARLSALRGIGRWTAEWILARTLGRPCVVAGDLGVRKAVGAAYLGTKLPPEDEVRKATAHWGAAAGVAQVLLLHGLSQETAIT